MSIVCSHHRSFNPFTPLPYINYKSLQISLSLPACNTLEHHPYTLLQLCLLVGPHHTNCVFFVQTNITVPRKDFSFYVCLSEWVGVCVSGVSVSVCLCECLCLSVCECVCIMFVCLSSSMPKRCASVPGSLIFITDISMPKNDANTEYTSNPL